MANEKVGDYRFRIPGGTGREPTIGGNGTINFDVFVEVVVEIDPVVSWALIPNGHFGLSVNADLIDGRTQAQIWAVLAKMIEDRGLAKGDKAQRGLFSLFPGGVWPDEDITEEIKLK